MSITTEELKANGYTILKDITIMQQEVRLVRLLNIDLNNYATDATSDQIAKALDDAIDKAITKAKAAEQKLLESNADAVVHVDGRLSVFDVLEEINNDTNIEILQRIEQDAWDLINPNDIINNKF